jgi:hypothetical protein
MQNVEMPTWPLTFLSLAVNLRTSGGVHIALMCFVWISEQTATFTLYSLSGLAFITETGCVYCMVQTESLYRVRQKYLTIWQHSCEWNRWRGELVLGCSSSETQSISVSMERWFVEHRAFAVETYLKTTILS